MAKHLYLVRSRHGVYKYRRAIPPPLRQAASGRREYIVSLNTRDKSAAQRAWGAVHAQADAYISHLEAITSGAPTSAEVLRAVGLAHLRRRGLEYIALDDLKQQNLEHPDHLGPSELDLRLEIIEDELGLPVDDPERRDEAINNSPEALAIMGSLPKVKFKLSDAEKLYLREKELLEHQNNSRSARQSRLRVNRVTAGMIDTNRLWV